MGRRLCARDGLGELWQGVEHQPAVARLPGEREADLDGIRRLLIVPDGPLQSLPFNVLVTESPPAPRPG